MTRNQSISHRDRNTAVVDPTTTSSYAGQHEASGYSGISPTRRLAPAQLDVEGGSADGTTEIMEPEHIQRLARERPRVGGWGLFGQRGNRDAGIANIGWRPSSHSNRHQREKYDIKSSRYNRRPSSGQWLKYGSRCAQLPLY
jgi:hypothetical protein